MGCMSIAHLAVMMGSMGWVQRQVSVAYMRSDDLVQHE